MSKKVLVVLTNTAKYPTLKRATGLWLGEAVHFVEVIENAGYKVDYVSPAGGYVPIDPHSLSMAQDLDWQWYDDKAFMNRLGSTLIKRSSSVTGWLGMPVALGPVGISGMYRRRGEVQAARPLIAALRETWPDHAITVSTQSPTGARTLRWGPPRSAMARDCSETVRSACAMPWRPKRRRRPRGRPWRESGLCAR